MQIQKLDTFGGHRDCVYTLEVSAQSDQFFSSGADGLVVRWNLRHPDQGELIARVPASVYALAFDQASGLLWVGQNYEGLHLIDPVTKTETSSLKLTSSAIYDIKLYGQTALAALSDGVVAVVDIPTLTVRKHLKASDKSARCVAVNPVEREFAVGYSDHTIRIFDLETYQLKRVLTAHTNSVFTVAYSPDFRWLLTAGRDAHLKAWDVEADYTLDQDIVAHLFAINHIAFSPDGQLFATASMDKAIKIWDTKSWRLLKVVDRARYAGHGTSVNRLLWPGFGGQFVSASDDRTISVWELTE